MSMRRRFLLFVLPIVGLVAAGAAWRLARDPATAATEHVVPMAPAVPVLAGRAEARDVPVFLVGLGVVQAFNTVTVKSRVDGQLDKIAYTEGKDVKEGDLLVQIDPRPFQAALGQALAAKARDEAQLANAKLDLGRYESLVNKEYATKQSVDTQRALVAQLTAALQGDQAAIDNARVQLQYATITAPISGRTGMRLVDQGNIVHANDANGLVIITQLQPISVIFTLPQDELDEVTAAMAKGPLKVLAFKRDDVTQLGEGTVQLIDNQIDQSTGTMRLKATFPNTNNALWPGAFVNARLQVTVRPGAITVPAQVIQRGPKGTYAYVIKPDLTVEQRPIKVGPTRDGVAIIDQGLAAGEQVVVDGQYKLRAGTRVEPRSGATKAAAQTGS
jgi:multidrug efflux system membrane fusion protein